MGAQRLSSAMMTSRSAAAWTPCTCRMALLHVLHVAPSRIGHSSWGVLHAGKQPWRARGEVRWVIHPRAIMDGIGIVDADIVCALSASG